MATNNVSLYSGTDLPNQDTFIIRKLSGVPKLALVYKTTSVIRSPDNEGALTCPNGVHNREVPLY